MKQVRHSRTSARREGWVDRVDSRLSSREAHLLRAVARVFSFSLPQIRIIPPLVGIDAFVLVPGGSAMSPPVRKAVSCYITELTRLEESRPRPLPVPVLLLTLLPLLHSHEHIHTLT